MKILWYVARKDLLQVLKDRGSFILLLLVPFVLITVLGLALGSLFSNGSNQIAITVAINNQDNDVVGNTLVNTLKINTTQLKITLNPYTTSEQVKQAVADGQGNITGIVIPAGTTTALKTASATDQATKNLIQFYSLPQNNDPRNAIVQNIVTSVMGQLGTAYFAGNAAIGQVQQICHQPGNTCQQRSIDSTAIARAVGQASTKETATAQIETLTAGQAPAKITGFDQAVPGYAILFALFGIQSAAATILQEKEDGTFRRLLIAPVQKYSLLGGKLLAQFILTFAQLLILFVLAYLAFHIHIGSWLGLITMLLVTSFATTGLGILLISLVKTRRQLSPVVTLVTLLTSAIGGAWWPLSIEPIWMQQVAKIGVTAWAMEGLNGIMLYGHTLEQALPSILGLLGYGTICFIIALRLFRFQEKTA